MVPAPHKPVKSKRISPTANVFFGCAYGMTERALTRSSWTADVTDTGVCQACGSAPNRSAHNSISGAKSERARKWSCAFQARLRMKRPPTPGFSGSSAKRRKRPMGADRASIRILSVDDHPLLREGVAALLAGQADMTLVAEASNGREAIEQFRIHRPDVTLMDIQMPEMNGVDAMIAICGEFPGAGIAGLTTYTGDVQVLRALKAGARGYLLKGLLRKELLETIRLVHAAQKRMPPAVATALPEP